MKPSQINGHNNIYNAAKIEYPREVLDRVSHALTYLSNLNIDEQELQVISESLGTVFDQDFVNSELLRSLKMKIPIEVPEMGEAKFADFFKIAKNYGWTLGDYFQFRNEAPNRSDKLIPPTTATAILNNRFLNEYQDWDKIDSKTQIIHSSQGTGKTEWALNELRNKTFLYITHREELARDFSIRAKNAGIPNVLYKDLDINGYRLVSSSIVICIDSLWKLNPENYKDHILIIDEFDQFVSHLHGSTCKENRIAIYLSLKEIAQNSDMNYFLSADFPKVTLDFISKVISQKDVAYIFNQCIPNPNRTLFLHWSEESVLQHAFERLKEGHKISIASFSKRKAQIYEKRFEEEFGGSKKRILCIVQDTKNLDEQRALLSDKSLVTQYDVIIFSPVISTGVDFNYPFSKYNYLMVNAGFTLNHFEGIQMVNRFRNFDELHVFSISNPEIDSANNFQLPGRIREKSVLGEFRKFSKNYDVTRKLREMNFEIPKRVKKDCGPFAINAFTMKRYRFTLLLNLFPNLINGFLSRGYKIQFYSSEGEKGPGTLAATSKTNETSVKEEEFEKILSAPDISKSEYLLILSQGLKYKDQIYSKSRFEIKSIIGFIDGEQDSELDFQTTVKSGISIELLRKRMRNFSLLYYGKNFARIKDNQILEKNMIQDYEYNEIKHSLFLQIFSLIPKDTWISGTSLSELMNFVKKNRSLISNNLFEVTTSHFKEPMRFVSSFLTLFDLKTEKKQVSKKKLSVYKIDKERYEFVRKRFQRMNVLKFGILEEHFEPFDLFGKKKD
ncbi:DEAD/DEAH box helicase family protein [Leptospira weilii]|uniref:plasmid replication protein, CyRepA1 family n=1 Tax=Leptospira weilii TaxID=28184 RepID=UPI00201B4A0D|nr:plasmid replication protein, CyRepA1 family [Leptospira weilii]UPY77569.1 DEAD/DEAH box helicase family protein [Leptospira weilii]